MAADRNIFFFDEVRSIRRSSRTLVKDVSDSDTDCNHVTGLFQALHAAGVNTRAFTHVGGRCADLRAGHDGTMEKTAEVHSPWGALEWILFGALCIRPNCLLFGGPRELYKADRYPMNGKPTTPGTDAC